MPFPPEVCTHCTEARIQRMRVLRGVLLSNLFQTLEATHPPPFIPHLSRVALIQVHGVDFLLEGYLHKVAQNATS